MRSLKITNFFTYCGFDCSIILDLKHKDRWREAYIVLTLHHFCPTGNKLIDCKSYLENMCEGRNGKWVLGYVYLESLVISLLQMVDIIRIAKEISFF